MISLVITNILCYQVLNLNLLLVVPTGRARPSTDSKDGEDQILPPWAVAVIVIGLASVAFVIVFGVSMVSG